MSDHEALGRSIDALSRFVVGQSSMSDTLQEVARLTVDAVEPADFAGITLNVDGRWTTGVFTNEESPEIDQAQYESGSGPCLEAFVGLEVVYVDSTDRDRRFPEFSRAAREHGIRSTLSMPLTVTGRGVGALNLYSHREDAFGDDDIELTRRFATNAAVVLANATAYDKSISLTDHMRSAMVSRETIDIARGIIIGATRCTPAEAFQRLVDQSQATNVKLRDVAAAIVAGAMKRPGPHP